MKWLAGFRIVCFNGYIGILLGPKKYLILVSKCLRCTTHIPLFIVNVWPSAFLNWLEVHNYKEISREDTIADHIILKTCG